MVPERWALIGKGKKDGMPMRRVAREFGTTPARLTIWTLVQRPNGAWYSVGQWISRGVYREFEDPQKLTDSFTDQRLLHHATNG